MTFIVLGEDEHWEILTNCTTNINWIRVKSINELLLQKNADAYFNLMEDSWENNYNTITAPVFINCVTYTLAYFNAAQNIIRLNAWHGFLQKKIWELAAIISPEVLDILAIIGKKHIAVPDITGFVSPRAIAMIINEAYFALGENVSTKAAIDTAMKLGTNYPYGPFEWGQKIGLHNVYNLLKHLAETDKRYTPATALVNEINNAK